MTAAAHIPAANWRLKTRVLNFSTIPCVMGIVNVTPDSFSDGGDFFSHERAIEHGLRLAAEGAEILDIGGESTRPYAMPVDAEEELRRVLPVVTALARKTNVPLSIDTSKAAVAEACLHAGAEIINDVTAGTGDPRMIRVARDTGAAICAMHMKETPQTMQIAPQYNNVAAEVRAYLAERKSELIRGGVEPAKICLDPGIGFGKTHEHNLELMRKCAQLHELGCPIMVGHSRKGFIGKVIRQDCELRGAAIEEDLDVRGAGTIGAACSLALQGVQILRVHEVRAVRAALVLFLRCRAAGPG
jgi:dihydropteroate synthase